MLVGQKYEMNKDKAGVTTVYNHNNNHDCTENKATLNQTFQDPGLFLVFTVLGMN